VRRVAWILTVLSVFLLADGLWLQLSHYHPADQNTFTGNPNLILSDGQVVLISAGFMTVATVVMWVLVFRREAQARQERAQHASRSASKA
jgi:hypothetical protein